MAASQVNASRGGVPKRPIPEATVDERGITVDQQADRRAHGHPTQALCLYALEQIVALRNEGHDVSPGSTGENITTLDIDWREVIPGARLRLGDEVLIEITDYASPCWKNANWFIEGDFNRINQNLYPGESRTYAKVLQGGTIRPGDPIEVIPESAGVRVERQQIPRLPLAT
ncbi:MAG: MOSC domain-containing protein [Dehalococcoidia bacterium]|nr:MOSC domain-containing protein [Dehalococcoidia bacterium]